MLVDKIYAYMLFLNLDSLFFFDNKKFLQL